MKNIWIIAKRDLSSFFNSPIFYVITTIFLIIYSYIFINILSFFSMQSMQAGQFQQMGIALNINEMVIEPSFQNMAVILLLIIPIVTMRSFSEEKKSNFPVFGQKGLKMGGGGPLNMLVYFYFITFHCKFLAYWQNILHYKKLSALKF